MCLHRLRSGHHYLNSFKHRIDPKADPSCIEIENPLHVLTVCPQFEPFRQKLRRMLQENPLDFSLGCNAQRIRCHQQLTYWSFIILRFGVLWSRPVWIRGRCPMISRCWFAKASFISIIVTIKPRCKIASLTLYSLSSQSIQSI